MRKIVIAGLAFLALAGAAAEAWACSRWVCRQTLTGATVCECRP